MKIRGDRKRSEILFIIVNLILSIFAISFMIALESESVSAQPDGPGSVNGEEQIIDGFNWRYDASKDDWTKLGPAGATVAGGSKTLSPTGYGKVAGWLGVTDKLGGNLIQGVQWAATAYFAIGLVGNMLGLEETLTKSLQYSVSAGLFGMQAFEGLQASGVFGTEGFLATANPALMGLGIGIVVFLMTYKKTEYQTVTFQCQPWEAPLGGEDCEKCNDGVHACSEYRCKSLGQACEIVNAEVPGKELCYWANPKDVSSPIISPWEDALTDSYRYTNVRARPPSWGTDVTPNSGGCIPAFTPIEFGINTNKPAQCKIDFNITRGVGQEFESDKINAENRQDTAYNSMAYYFGGNSLYDYNHTQRMNLPGPDAINSLAEANNESGGLEIRNDGRYNLYVRCRSKNGYYNADPYVISFCVDKGPDVTAPKIMETNIENNQPVSFEVDSVPIIVYTNEPSTCRWSREDKVFANMENNMSCAKDFTGIQSNLYYACSGDLTSIEDRKDNNFYFRCEDQPWKEKSDRNVMSSGYKLTLKGTQQLNIDKSSIKPANGTVSGATSVVNVTLELKTQNGYKDGEAKCYYSVGNENAYVPFFETDSFMHKQRQDLREGTYTYFFKCIDLGGNQDKANATFQVRVDTQPPQVVRMFYDASNLKIITDEDAECYYSDNSNTKCNYALDDNAKSMPHESSDNKKEHFAPWDLKNTFYIKCKDVNDKQPSPTECSAIVRPVDIISSVEVDE